MILKLLKRTPTPNPTDLGTVLQKMGAVTAEQLQAGVEAQSRTEPRPQLGDALVRLGAITREQLADALLKQKQLRNGGRINALADMARAAEDEISRELVRLGAAGTGGRP